MSKPGTNPNHHPQSGVEPGAPTAEAQAKAGAGAGQTKATPPKLPPHLSKLEVLSLPERIARELEAHALHPVGDDEGYSGPELEVVRAHHNGKIFALWPKAADKESADGHAGLWQVIDGSTWSAIPVASRLASAMDSTLSDANLSPLGRRSSVAELLRVRAAPALKQLGQRWLGVRNQFAELGDDLAGIEAYRASQPWQWAIDIEAGRFVRDQTDEARRLLVLQLGMGEHPELAESVLRLPAHLHGIGAAHLARIRAAVMERRDPGAGAREQVRRAALEAAATAIKTLYNQVTSGGWIDRITFHKLMGPEALEALVFTGMSFAELVEAPPLEFSKVVEQVQPL